MPDTMSEHEKIFAAKGAEVVKALEKLTRRVKCILNNENDTPMEKAQFVLNDVQHGVIELQLPALFRRAAKAEEEK